MLKRILPTDVAVGETFTELPEHLFPQEEAFIADAVAKRRREFRSVRGCARAALRQLGVERPPLLPGQRGAPTWPPGVVGAMTHCAGYRAAAVTCARTWATIGIDAEPHAPLPREVLDAVALPEEREDLRALARARPDVCWDRVLFSAKESVYKVWSPTTGSWLGFEDARLTIHPDTGTFTARLLVTAPPGSGSISPQMTGHWLANRRLILTAIATPVPRQRSIGVQGRPRILETA